MVKLKKNNCKVILALFFLIAQIIIYNNNPLKTILIIIDISISYR